MPIISIDMVLARISKGHSFVQQAAKLGDLFNWFEVPEDVRIHFEKKNIANQFGFTPPVSTVIKATDPNMIIHMIGRIRGPF